MESLTSQMMIKPLSCVVEKTGLFSAPFYFL